MEINVKVLKTQENVEAWEKGKSWFWRAKYSKEIDQILRYINGATQMHSTVITKKRSGLIN